MKRRAMMIACGMAALAPAAFGFTLVERGAPRATIVVPARESNGVREGLRTLNAYIEKIAGVPLPVKTELEPIEGPVVVLGVSRLVLQYGLDPQELKYDNWRIKSGENYLLIAGRDVDLPGGTVRSLLGTHNGVVDFLERYGGVRWFMPGRSGEVVPRESTLRVPDTIDVRGEKRVLWGVPSYAMAWRPRWRGAPGLQVRTCGGHSWHLQVPVETYFKEHPEYFALVAGKRSNHKWSSLCVTHPDVLQISVDWAKRELAGADVLELGHPDSYGSSCAPCECETCRALGDLGERVYWFHSRIAEAIREWNPAKKLMPTAYGPTARARAQWKYPENVIVELCNLDALEKGGDGYVPWNANHTQFSAYVYFWWAGSQGDAPLFSQRALIDAFALFRKYNIRIVYYCGAPSHWGVEAPQYYLDYRLRMDLNADPAAVLNEFYAGFYGAAAEPMRAFYGLIEDVQATPVVGGRKAEHIYLSRWPLDRCGEAMRLLDEADAAAGDDTTLRVRIDLARPAIEYAALTARGFEAHRRYQGSGSPEDLEAMAGAVAERAAWVDAQLLRQKAGAYRDAGLRDPFLRTGPDDLRRQLLTGRSGRLGAPFTIDFGTMLPFVRRHGVMKAGALRAPAPPRIDGVIDELLWQDARELLVAFENTSGRPLDVPARVRAAWDAEALYVAYTVDEPLIDAMERKPYEIEKGRVWNEDCVELFLGDPAEGSRKYVHLIVSFTNGRYDGRGGFIEDELDPLYYGEDERWRGQWRSAVQIDAGKKQWTVELAVPWKTLEFGGAGVEALRANFCRERWTGQQNGPALAAWSPTFAGFQERTRFGWLDLHGNGE
ncbi:MAG: DUF4838 domain-containing protein [Kiritimatiellae bacterium]|nr:DUF4838 domain-containing protein [Kiritimatiellia bacterium]